MKNVPWVRFTALLWTIYDTTPQNSKDTSLWTSYVYEYLSLLLSLTIVSFWATVILLLNYISRWASTICTNAKAQHWTELTLSLSRPVNKSINSILRKITFLFKWVCRSGNSNPDKLYVAHFLVFKILTHCNQNKMIECYPTTPKG